MTYVLQDEKLTKFVDAFFREWGNDIFSIILIPKKKKVTCIVNGFKRYEFSKDEIIGIL